MRTIATHTVPGTGVTITLAMNDKNEHAGLHSVEYRELDFLDIDKLMLFRDENDARLYANHLWTEAVKARDIKGWSKEITEGLWAVDDMIYKVQKNLAGTHLYAKVLTEDGWDYTRGAISKLKTSPDAHRLTEEDAARYGKLYGTCCICGRKLTNEESIERGIGSICASNQGW